MQNVCALNLLLCHLATTTFSIQNLSSANLQKTTSVQGDKRFINVPSTPSYSIHFTYSSFYDAFISSTKKKKEIKKQNSHSVNITK